MEYNLGHNMPENIGVYPRFRWLSLLLVAFRWPDDVIQNGRQNLEKCLHGFEIYIIRENYCMHVIDMQTRNNPLLRCLGNNSISEGCEVKYTARRPIFTDKEVWKPSLGQAALQHAYCFRYVFGGCPSKHMQLYDEYEWRCCMFIVNVIIPTFTNKMSYI